MRMGNEINRILKLYADLQHGDCWLGTNFKQTLHGINTTSAQKEIAPGRNNIWQLTSHIIYWRTKVTNRMEGNNNPPPFIDFRLPEYLNEETWKQELTDFESVYHLLRNSIHNFHEENLDKPSPKEGQTYYQLIMGCLQHDAYHLGQIVLLKKSFNL